MNRKFLQKVDELRLILIQMERAFPNGYDSLKWEATNLFQQLTDLPFEDD